MEVNTAAKKTLIKHNKSKGTFAVVGPVTASTTITAGTGVTATTGNITATAGVLSGLNMLNNTTADPGHNTAIPVTKSTAIILTIGSSGAETNTLAAPTYAGQMLYLCADTVGTGTRVVTCSTRVNKTGNNTITFNAVDDSILLLGVNVGGNLRWRVIYNNSAGLSTV